ncbi:hypothetical protein, partial [Mesorhizobium sp.]|uniref:hypothetical protein n=1 Tax=Mesorhizobium sp. TaxID=1871066 RepID=UPI0025C5CBDC
MSPVDPPEIVSLTALATGRGAAWRITLAGAGAMTLPPKDVLQYRKFHARAMEQLLVVFAWMEHRRWSYQLLLALCRT